MRKLFCSLVALLAIAVPAAAVEPALPIFPGLPGGDAIGVPVDPHGLPLPLPPIVTGPVPYWFGVVIERTAPDALPSVQGTLMAGCAFTATQNVGRVECSPPTAPAAGTYWVCTSPGLIATATSGTVNGRTACAGGPAAIATASNPEVAWGYDIEIGVWGFSWRCEVEFVGSATGNLLCDEPDPPVAYWNL